MTLFLLNFFVIYGSAHAYFLLRLLTAFPGLQRCWLLPAAWCLLMVVSPLITRMLERSGQTGAATAVAYLGYSWMGVLFVFTAVALVLELTRLIRWLGQYLVALPRLPFAQPTVFFSLSFGLAILICGYGLFEARHLRTERQTLTTDKLPKGSRGIRIVQISDLHIGLIVGPSQVRRVVEAIRQTQPDLVVATGDMVDGHISHLDGVSAMFRSLAPAQGMFAVFGNHEYYAGAAMSRKFLEQAGFKLLQGQTVLVGPQLALAGVDDPAGARFTEHALQDEQAVLRTIPTGRYVVLLKHRPETETASTGQFDLQLSGHVHKGQIFPFNLLTWLRFPVRAGMNQLAGGGHLYVSRGTGTWGPPIRFLAPPEVTIIDLVPLQK